MLTLSPHHRAHPHSPGGGNEGEGGLHFKWAGSATLSLEAPRTLNTVQPTFWCLVAYLPDTKTVSYQLHQDACSLHFS